MMRAHSFAEIGVFYSATTIILLAVMAVVLFKESLGLREMAGIGLALASVAVMGKES